MSENLKGVIVEMGARTSSQPADDFESIASVLRSGEGVSALPSRLMLGPRALTINVQTDTNRVDGTIQHDVDEQSDDNRTSAVGLFNYAHSYAASAVSLSKSRPDDTTHPEAPVDFLSFHAVELYLKSFLRANGLTVRDVKKVGHRLVQLSNKARELGLIYEDASGVIRLATDNLIERRYISIGSNQRHPTEMVFAVCRSLHTSVGEELRRLGFAKRLPSIGSLS